MNPCVSVLRFAFFPVKTIFNLNKFFLGHAKVEKIFSTVGHTSTHSCNLMFETAL